MGYSIYSVARSRKAFLEMKAFLRKNYRPFHKIVPGVVSKDFDGTRYLRFGNEIDYGARKLSIGFNYSNGHNIRTYMTGILSWISLQIGKRKKILDYGKVPYIVYDGTDRWPVLVNDPGEYGTDELGFVPELRFWKDWPPEKLEQSKEYIQEEEKRITASDDAVKAELQRLNKLWKNR